MSVGLYTFRLDINLGWINDIFICSKYFNNFEIRINSCFKQIEAKEFLHNYVKLFTLSLEACAGFVFIKDRFSVKSV